MNNEYLGKCFAIDIAIPTQTKTKTNVNMINANQGYSKDILN